MDAPARCRNCNAPVTGAYCASCGQETDLRVPTLREFIREAGGRYVAFDGILWRTLGALLLRPGFLTLEYLAGRRRRYVRPFRLYLAASLLSFLVAGIVATQTQVVKMVIVPQTGGGSAAVAKADAPGRPVTDAARNAAEDAEVLAAADKVTVSLPAPFKSAEAVIRQRMESFLALSGPQRARQLEAGTRHNAPYAMFVLVPAFALLLKLAYPRRPRLRQRPSRYGEHLVFAVHNHAFLFLALTVVALLPAPASWFIWAWAPIYFVLSLRNVYGGGWAGSIARGGLIALAYTPLVAATIAVLVVLAVLVG